MKKRKAYTPNPFSCFIVLVAFFICQLSLFFLPVSLHAESLNYEYQDQGEILEDNFSSNPYYTPLKNAISTFLLASSLMNPFQTYDVSQQLAQQYAPQVYETMTSPEFGLGVTAADGAEFIRNPPENLIGFAPNIMGGPSLMDSIIQASGMEPDYSLFGKWEPEYRGFMINGSIAASMIGMTATALNPTTIPVLIALASAPSFYQTLTDPETLKYYQGLQNDIGTIYDHLTSDSSNDYPESAYVPPDFKAQSEAAWREQWEHQEVEDRPSSLPEPLNSDLTKPVDFFEANRISRDFSRENSTHPVEGIPARPHDGIDLAGPDVKNVVGGEVVKIGFDPNGYGQYVDIYHPESNKTTRHAHILLDPNLKEGNMVDAGQILGETAPKGHPSAGVSTGPHDHFEIWDGKRDDYNLSGEERRQSRQEHLLDPKDHFKDLFQGMTNKDNIDLIRNQAERLGITPVSDGASGQGVEISGDTPIDLSKWKPGDSLGGLGGTGIPSVDDPVGTYRDAIGDYQKASDERIQNLLNWRDDQIEKRDHYLSRLQNAGPKDDVGWLRMQVDYYSDSIEQTNRDIEQARKDDAEGQKLIDAGSSLIDQAQGIRLIDQALGKRLIDQALGNKLIDQALGDGSMDEASSLIGQTIGSNEQAYQDRIAALEAERQQIISERDEWLSQIPAADRNDPSTLAVLKGFEAQLQANDRRREEAESDYREKDASLVPRAGKEDGAAKQNQDDQNMSGAGESEPAPDWGDVSIPGGGVMDGGNMAGGLSTFGFRDQAEYQAYVADLEKERGQILKDREVWLSHIPAADRNTPDVLNILRMFDDQLIQIDQLKAEAQADFNSLKQESVQEVGTGQPAEGGDSSLASEPSLGISGDLRSLPLGGAQRNKDARNDSSQRHNLMSPGSGGQGGIGSYGSGAQTQYDQDSDDDTAENPESGGPVQSILPAINPIDQWVSPEHPGPNASSLELAIYWREMSYGPMEWYLEDGIARYLHQAVQENPKDAKSIIDRIGMPPGYEPITDADGNIIGVGTRGDDGVLRPGGFEVEPASGEPAKGGSGTGEPATSEPSEPEPKMPVTPTDEPNSDEPLSSQEPISIPEPSPDGKPVPDASWMDTLKTIVSNQPDNMGDDATRAAYHKQLADVYNNAAQVDPDEARNILTPFLLQRHDPGFQTVDALKNGSKLDPNELDGHFNYCGIGPCSEKPPPSDLPSDEPKEGPLEPVTEEPGAQGTEPDASGDESGSLREPYQVDEHEDPAPGELPTTGPETEEPGAKEPITGEPVTPGVIQAIEDNNNYDDVEVERRISMNISDTIQLVDDPRNPVALATLSPPLVTEPEGVDDVDFALDDVMINEAKHAEIVQQPIEEKPTEPVAGDVSQRTGEGGETQDSAASDSEKGDEQPTEGLDPEATKQMLREMQVLFSGGLDQDTDDHLGDLEDAPTGLPDMQNLVNMLPDVIRDVDLGDFDLSDFNLTMDNSNFNQPINMNDVVADVLSNFNIDLGHVGDIDQLSGSQVQQLANNIFNDVSGQISGGGQVDLGQVISDHLPDDIPQDVQQQINDIVNQVNQDIQALNVDNINQIIQDIQQQINNYDLDDDHHDHDENGNDI